MEELEEESSGELILDVRALPQAYKFDCGPTALRIVLQYQFGLKMTAKDMIFLTGATKDYGSNEIQLKNALSLLGFKWKESDRGTLNSLKNLLQDGQPPIVHLVMHDGTGHYMVFAGYDEENVYLADPAKGKVLKYGIAYFFGVWKVEEEETNTRWYLAITGYVGDKITQRINKLKRIQKKVIKSRK